MARPVGRVAVVARLSLAIVLGVLIAGCGQSEMTVTEFCELSRDGDLQTVRLFQMQPGSEEWQGQLEVVRGINQRLFANPPAAIAPVAEELAPLLETAEADNDRVNQLLDQVTAYVEQNCPSL